MKRVLLSIVAATMTASFAGPAVAHVTVQPNEAPIGAFFRFVVRVPNERPDAATTKVEVQFPETLVFVSFQDKPGWDRRVRMKTLDEPIEVFGDEITEVVGSVTWSGGRIQPGEFDEFGFSARVPEEESALEFPALQTYDSGEIVRWIGPPDADEPAARVSIVDLAAEEGQGQLAVIASLRDEIAGLRADLSASAPEDDSGYETDPMVFGIAGLGAGLGAIALIVALSRGR